MVEPGKQTLPDGTQLDIPPICFAELGHDKSKKTILIYGHLDVQPALKSDGWDTDPFVLTEKDGKLYGRGSTDDKVCIMYVICALYICEELCSICYEGDNSIIYINIYYTVL